MKERWVVIRAADSIQKRGKSRKITLTNQSIYEVGSNRSGLRSLLNILTEAKQI
jgi:hypothetical protein